MILLCNGYTRLCETSMIALGLALYPQTDKYTYQKNCSNANYKLILTLELLFHFRNSIASFHYQQVRNNKISIFSHL